MKFSILLLVPRQYRQRNVQEVVSFKLAPTGDIVCVTDVHAADKVHLNQKQKEHTPPFSFLISYLTIVLRIKTRCQCLIQKSYLKLPKEEKTITQSTTALPADKNIQKVTCIAQTAIENCGSNPSIKHVTFTLTELNKLVV